jgi:DNA-binding winged helix-turn-helix (wHTH) protein
MSRLAVPLPVRTPTAQFERTQRAVSVEDGARSFLFGPYVLKPERQSLMRNGIRVRIGGRALDILTALVECPGTILSKRELLSRAWPNLSVEDSNLKVTVASLRRIFGEQPEVPEFIATVIGRGYRFVAPVEVMTPTGATWCDRRQPRVVPMGRYPECRCPDAR